MKKILLLLLLLSLSFYVWAQTEVITYTQTTSMIPMRDGIKLFTTIITPTNAKTTVPVLMIRTPYNAERPADFDITSWPYVGNMAKEGYIFVIQDVRGKYKSEGTMEIHSPLTHIRDTKSIDESTDTYDTIDWVIKNIPNNNGKVGLLGVSYPGWLALVGAVNPHPALKASSEQACMSDLWLGDDFHHNGAFRLSYGVEYTYRLENTKEGSTFNFPQYDLYDWYLKLGSLKNVNDKYFHNKIPTWNNFANHPNYDDFWQKNSPLSYVKEAQVPMLHVGGYYDQEDILGPQLMYQHMEKQDKSNLNYICLGPWNHGQWSRKSADSLGKIKFDSNTAEWFQTFQKKWFDYWLKGIGDGKFQEATSFQTGTNQWKSYETWPPKEAKIQKLYASADNTCSFAKPVKTGIVSYISDPAKPIPYRTPPIEFTYAPSSRWGSWQVEDQRFVYSRPDVVSFRSEAMTEDMTVTGEIIAHLFASTTGSDADWVVKLIDEYPDFDSKNTTMSGFHLAVAMEVFRGRFHKSFEKPQPLVPNKVEEFKIDLHQINHTFKKGHRMIIQVQSTWFPVIDRNPQKYVANIFEAKESDFIKAEHKIYCSPTGTYIEIPVIK